MGQLLNKKHFIVVLFLALITVFSTLSGSMEMQDTRENVVLQNISDTESPVSQNKVPFSPEPEEETEKTIDDYASHELDSIRTCFVALAINASNRLKITDLILSVAVPPPRLSSFHLF